MVWQTFPFYLLHRDEHMSAGFWEIYAPDKAAKKQQQKKKAVKPDLKGGHRVNPSSLLDPELGVQESAHLDGIFKIVNR